MLFSQTKGVAFATTVGPKKKNGIVSYYSAKKAKEAVTKLNGLKWEDKTLYARPDDLPATPSSFTLHPSSSSSKS